MCKLHYFQQVVNFVEVPEAVTYEEAIELIANLKDELTITRSQLQVTKEENATLRTTFESSKEESVNLKMALESAKNENVNLRTAFESVKKQLNSRKRVGDTSEENKTSIKTSLK